MVDCDRSHDGFVVGVSLLFTRELSEGIRWNAPLVSELISLVDTEYSPSVSILPTKHLNVM